MFNKSKVAPMGLVERPDYYIMGDKYIRNLLVVALPSVFGLGMMSYYTSNPNIKVFQHTRPLDMDISKALNKEYKEKLEQYKKTQDQELKKRLELQLSSLEDYINEVVSGNDKTLNLTIVFSIQTNSLEELRIETQELKGKLRHDGFKVETVTRQQFNLLKLTSPIFMESGMDSTLEENIGIPITSKSFAGLYPYTFESIKDEKGFVFGKEANNAGIILWDPMLYDNNPDKAKAENRLSSNIILLGKTGSGKTTDLSLILRNLIREKVNIIWIDPENKNKYLTEKYNGTFIQWGVKENQINIFDLRPISIDEDEREVDAYDAELSMYQAIDDFKQLLQLYKPNIHDDTMDVVSEVMINLYGRFNIHKSTKFKLLEATDYPILSDFLQQIEIELEGERSGETKRSNALIDLKMKITPMTIEHKYYFDGHTTVKQGLDSRNILSFGTKVLFNKSLELRNAMNFLMFSYIKSIALDETKVSAVAFGEAHLYLNEGAAAREISILYRRSRKYHNVGILDTQEPADLNNEEIKIYGNAIINNSTYKIVKQLEKKAIQSLDDLITLTDNEKESIELFRRGEALFICGDKKLRIHVVATDKELYEINPEGMINASL